MKYFGIDSTKIEKPFVIEDPSEIKKAAPKTTFNEITKFIENLTDIN